MGHNTLANLMSMAAEECGLERKTNHCVQNTIKTLRKAGVARDKVKHITGHKSTSSIEAYDDCLSDDEQCQYSDVFTGTKSTIAPVVPTRQVQNELVLAKPSTITREPTEQNCGFNNFNTAISTPVLKKILFPKNLE